MINGHLMGRYDRSRNFTGNSETKSQLKLIYRAINLSRGVTLMAYFSLVYSQRHIHSSALDVLEDLGEEYTPREAAPIKFNQLAE